MGVSRGQGYTLVEVIVALVVFTTGALGLAAGSAIVTREMAANGTRSLAGRLARNRQEQFQAGCPGAESGSETHGSVRSAWTVVTLASSLALLDGRISYPTPRGNRTDAYTLTVWCR